MKIVNEKGKLFGLVNVVDLLVILLIVAVVFAIGWQLLGQQIQNTVSPQVELRMEAEIIGAAPRIHEEAMRQELAGERLVGGNAYLDAYIVDVWLEDYVTQAIRDDGVIVDALDPTKKNIVFLISTQVAADTASPKIGSQEVRAGKADYLVKTQTFECAATIRYVEIDGVAQE